MCAFSIARVVVVIFQQQGPSNGETRGPPFLGPSTDAANCAGNVAKTNTKPVLRKKAMSNLEIVGLIKSCVLLLTARDWPLAKHQLCKRPIDVVRN